MSSEHQEFRMVRLTWDRVSSGKVPPVSHCGTFSASIEAKEKPLVIAVDECAEVSPEDIEKLREHPCMQSFMQSQSFIKTENSDWLREYIDNPE